jgi:hypothetical protein
VQRRGADSTDETEMNAALAVIDGIMPENETEAMLERFRFRWNRDEATRRPYKAPFPPRLGPVP